MNDAEPEVALRCLTLKNGPVEKETGEHSYRF
jgi:hypothetical protein